MAGATVLRVTSPPRRPTMVWDGHCGFCAHWVERWKQHTGDAVEYVPYQELGERFPEIPVESFKAAAHLIESDGAVTTGAEAAYRALAHGGKPGALRAYKRIPGYAALCEWGYRRIANHRGLAFKFTKLLIGMRLLK